MAVASAVQTLAFTGPIEFRFAQRNTVKAQVRFYLDSEGTAEIAKGGTGTRDAVVTTKDLVVELAGAELHSALDSDYAGGTKTLTNGTWTEFEFADGAINASWACSGGANPAGAVSYRVILSITKPTPQP